MKGLPLFFAVCISCLLGCQAVQEKKIAPSLPAVAAKADSIPLPCYTDLKKEIAARRRQFAQQYKTASPENRQILLHEIKLYWVNTIGNQLYRLWQYTPWDFNGTTSTPREGSIACGFFVTAILQDMDLRINRHALSVCASSEMMKKLVPTQKIRKMNALSYTAFHDSLKREGPGIYIIGLDYHTGFIINDSSSSWFLHSYYVQRKGVTKERVLLSSALQSSQTRWIVSLTSDTAFIEKWLRG